MTPTTMAATGAAGRPNSNTVIMYAAIPPANPSTDPADRSIFAETITISIPTAMMPVTDIWVIRLDRLRAVRKVFPGVAQWKYTQITPSTAIMMYARSVEAVI